MCRPARALKLQRMARKPDLGGINVMQCVIALRLAGLVFAALALHALPQRPHQPPAVSASLAAPAATPVATDADVIADLRLHD